MTDQMTWEATALMSSPEAGSVQAWERIALELKRISLFDYDWDDLDAERPNDEVISDAFRLLWALKDSEPWNPPGRVVASPTGTIIFEWQYQDALIEVEIEEPGIAEYCLKERNKPPQFKTFNFVQEESGRRDETWDQPREEVVEAA